MFDPLSLGLSLGSSILGWGMNERNNQESKELAKYNWDRQVDLWNKQNAYNTPTAQMERYQAAGLNPNLIYGNGASSAGNSTSLPSTHQPNLKPYQMPDLGQTYAQLANLNAQNKNLEANNELIKSQVNLNQLKSVEQSVKNLRDQFGFDVIKEMQPTLNEITRQQLEEAKHNAEKRKWEAANEHTNHDFNYTSMQLRFDRMIKENDKLDAEIRVLGNQLNVQNSQIKEFLSKSLVNFAQKSNLDADTAYKVFTNSINDKLVNEIIAAKKAGLSREEAEAALKETLSLDRRATHVYGDGWISDLSRSLMMNLYYLFE